MNNLSTALATRPGPGRTVRSMLLGLVLGLVAASSGPALAGGRAHSMMEGSQPVERVVERMLRGVEVSEQQRSQIRQIAQAAASDLRSEHATGRRLRAEMTSQFAQPHVDAAAIEALRQKSMMHKEVVSQRMTQALVDAARVLTPQQRAQLAEQMAERQRRFEQRMMEREANRTAPANQ